MDIQKRQAKLSKTLNLVKLRLAQQDSLRRIELSGPGIAETWTVEGDGIIIRGKESSLSEIPARLEKILAPMERGEVRLVERGSLVIITLFPGDVKFGISTLDDVVHQQAVPETGTRQQFVRAGEAMELLQALEIASTDGKIRTDRRRKYYQVDRFVELVDEMLDWREERPLRILDCGCGKSYLSFVLNWWLTEKRRISCHVTGIDSNPGVIQAAQVIQKRLGYRNMDFMTIPVREYTTRQPVDMVLSLHACDTATDEALALGLSLNSRYIISVPCCQAWLKDRVDLGPWQVVAKHKIFKNRLADVLTDGLRAAALEARGYRVSVVEYVSPLDTPKNIMLRAVLGNEGAREAEYRQLQCLVDEELPLEIFLNIFTKR